MKGLQCGSSNNSCDSNDNSSSSGSGKSSGCCEMREKSDERMLPELARVCGEPEKEPAPVFLVMVLQTVFCQALDQ